MKVATLNQTHPTRDGAALGRFRALAEGGQAWRDQIGTWLPKNAREPEEIYADRCNRAAYHNYAGSILGMLGGYLFSEDPQVEGLPDTYSEAFLANTDRQGTPWARWWKQAFLDALTGKTVLAWVNLPARDPQLVQPASLADEETAGLLDAYLVEVKAEDLLDWGTDPTGALTWVVLRHIISDRDGVESDRTRKYRWTFINAAVIRQWEWLPRKDQADPKPEDEAQELAQIVHGFKRLPLIRMELPHSLWAMELLHDPAVAALRARNDLSWALHKSAHAMMTLERKWDGDDPVVGPGYYLKLEQGDKVGWTEPAGTSFAVLQQDVETLKDEVYRVINQMALAVNTDSSRQRASGDSKQADWQAADVVMAAYAGIVLDAMRETAQLVATVRGGDASKVSVKGLDGWQTMSLTDFLQGVALAIAPAKMSPTFRREVAKREAERLLGHELDDETMQTIRDEIDAAPDEDTMFGGPTGPTIGQGAQDDGDGADPENAAEDDAETPPVPKPKVPKVPKSGT